MPDSTPPATGQAVLAQALVMAQPLATWLVRSGIGHAEFAAALKPVFLAAAQAEQARIGGKQTDSALSLLAGLHRKDVRTHSRGAAIANEASAQLGRPTPANQVVTRWLTSGLPDSLPVAGVEPSFESLARSVSKDIHPRTVVQELVRLGIVDEEDGSVTLRRQAFVPDASHDESRKLLAGSVADHISAGVHNLTSGASKKYLEQSVFADGLTAESAQQLETLASQLWRQVLKTMVDAAVPLVEKDAAAGGDQRVRLGMFCLSATMAQDTNPDHDNASKEGPSA